jgi:hypothetical protein
MQIPLLHQQILLQSERLRDIHRTMMNYNGSIPAKEMENFLLEIRNLYNLALQLNNENSINLLNEIQLAVNETKSKNVPEVTPVASETSLKNIVEEIPEKTKIEIKLEEKSSDKKKIASDIHELYKESPTLANKFTDKKTVGAKIAGNENTRRISDNLKASVTDLKSAIGLNEKFQFINQLFNGDAKKYHSAIEQLNTSNGSEDAMNFLKEISETNDWESHAAVAKSFMDIIDRRFSA